MTLDSLIHIVNKLYPDGCVLAYWNAETERPRAHGLNGKDDILARFIVCELHDTYEESADDKKQLATAIHAVKKAEAELATVRKGLEEAQRKAKAKVIPFPRKKP